MTSRLPLALAIIGLASTSVLSTTFTAKAQGMSPPMETAMPGKGTAPKMDSMTKIPGTASEASGRPRFSAEDHAAFLEARVAALHAGLTLTPAQEKMWPPLEQALRDFSKLARTQRHEMHEKKQSLDFVGHLQLRSAHLIARGEALKKIADAASPLYATFTDAQKTRLPVLLRATMHPFRKFMMGMGGSGRGMMGTHMMYRMCHGMMGHGKMGSHMMGGQDKN